MFNAVVRLCLSKMEPALRKVLRLQSEKEGATATTTMKASRLQKSKKWTACNRDDKMILSAVVSGCDVSYPFVTGLFTTGLF